MTQAIVNSTEIIQNGVYTAETQNTSDYNADLTNTEGVDKTTLLSFNTILDKTIKKQDITEDSKTEISESGDMSVLLSDLNEILVQTMHEVNMEKSLNLTLTKNVAETINSIKSISDTLVNKIEEVAEKILPESDDEAVVYANVQEQAETDNAEIDNAETNESKEKSPKFEQILTYFDNNNNNNTLHLPEKELEVVSDFKEQNLVKEEITYKSNEYEELDTEKLAEESENSLDEKLLSELKVEFAESEMSDENLMDNRQSPEELGIKIMLNHSVEKADQTFVKVANFNETTKPSSVTPEKIIEQITKHMDSLKGNQGVKLVLNPESLGKVNLQIINTKEGLSAQFTVTTNEARNLLMKGLEGLKETLLSQGVGVDNITVKINETEETSYNQDWTEQENSENNHKEQQKQNKEEKEKGLFEKTIAQSLNKENGKV